MSSPAARAAILHMLPGHLAEAGVDPNLTFRAGGMEPGLTQTDAIVHRAQLSAVLDASAQALGQAHLGLILGSAADPVRLGRAGQALMSGRSIGECLHAHASQMPAMQTHVRLGLRLEPGRAVWAHRLDGHGRDAPRVIYEGAAAFHLQFLRSLLGSNWSPACVVFPHANRGRRRDYEDHFGAPVVFGEGQDASLLFDPAVLRRRVVLPANDLDGDPSAAERELMAYRLRDQPLLQALEALVTARLAHDPVTLAVSARILGVSPRTLQRRLDEAGLTFELLVDGLRRELATHRLREGASITDVAMSLGYSDTAHFTRAFRRWTGVTPSAFRDGERG